MDERFQFADAPLTGAAGELGLELLLDDAGAELVQSLHLPRRQGSLGHVGVWLAAERLGRLTEHVDELAGLTTGDRLAGIGEELGDHPGVDLDCRWFEQVPAAAFNDRRRAERSSQPGDVPLQRLAGRWRRVARPHRLLQHIDPHSFASPRSQGGQHGPLHGSQVDRCGTIDQLHRSEDP